MAIRKQPRTAFSLVEMLIVVVLLSILASVVLMSFTDCVSETKVDVARHSLSQMRAHLERYKARHGGRLPSSTLVELASATNAQGELGNGPEYRYGPYILEIPENPLTGSSAVITISNSPPLPGDVDEDAGWMYNERTGEIWISHRDHYLE